VPAFFYLDLDDARRRAALLTLAVRNRAATPAALKTEYARTLAQIGNAPLNTAAEPRIASGGSILRIARARRLVDDSGDSASYNAASRAFAMRRVEHSLLFLRLQHPPLRDLCDLLITDIVVWPSAKVGGGSTTNLVGIAWLVPSGNLTALDIAESVVHEMVHMNLHLADMTFGLFSRAPGSGFDAPSAVLGRHRPHYHAFHSACVAVAIIYFWLFLGLESELGSMRSSLRRCTSELLRHRPAFTQYAWRAIVAAHAFARTPKLSAIPVHRQLMKLA
jgi:hypothetical protein